MPTDESNGYPKKPKPFKPAIPYWIDPPDPTAIVVTGAGLFMGALMMALWIKSAQLKNALNQDQAKSAE